MPATEIVLVHGLYHQPAHLQPLVDALRVRGVRVHVPGLHRGSLDADIAAVQQTIDGCACSPVVVGHSYGGAVISGVQGVAALVYLAAFVPDVGESCAFLGGADALVNLVAQPYPDGGTYVPAEVAGELFYGDCDPTAAERAVNLLVPQAAGHGRGAARFAGWRHTFSLYIVCTRDRAVSPELQHQMARRCTAYEIIDASHSAYISQPARIADLVLNVPVAAGAALVDSDD